MKLYLVTATPSDTAVEDARSSAMWVGSQAEAASARKLLGTAGFRRAEIITSEVEVPTTKTDLLSFLNILSAGPTVAAAHLKLTAK